jgi:hypothetical protein
MTRDKLPDKPPKRPPACLRTCAHGIRSRLTDHGSTASREAGGAAILPNPLDHPTATRTKPAKRPPDAAAVKSRLNSRILLFETAAKTVTRLAHERLTAT